MRFYEEPAIPAFAYDDRESRLIQAECCSAEVIEIITEHPQANL